MGLRYFAPDIVQT